MIASQAPSQTDDYALKKTCSKNPDPVVPQLIQTAIKVPLNHSDPAAENRKITDRCIEKLVKSGFGCAEHVRSYLIDMQRRGCRPNTIRTCFDAILPFFAFLEGRGRTGLDSIGREDLGAFIEHEQDRGMSACTVAARLRYLYAILNYLAERDLANPALLKKKFTIKVPDSLPRAIDPQDVRKLLSVIEHVRHRAMVLVLLRTGMRIGELLALKVEDVNLRERRIEIFEARKTRTGRVVYLSDDAYGALMAWLKIRCAEKEQLFYANGRNTMTYEAARNMFNRHMEKAGLSHKRYTLHCLRHTFASELLNAGMRLECVQQLLGHSCIEMTRRYARLTDNTRKEEYFRAMAIIEKGGINGYYRIDPKLPQAPETEELLCTYY